MLVNKKTTESEVPLVAPLAMRSLVSRNARQKRTAQHPSFCFFHYILNLRVFVSCVADAACNTARYPPLTKPNLQVEEGLLLSFRFCRPMRRVKYIFVRPQSAVAGRSRLFYYDTLVYNRNALNDFLILETGRAVTYKRSSRKQVIK